MLGETADLNEFLFGSERAVLAVERPILLDIQPGRCFNGHAPLTPAATHDYTLSLGADIQQGQSAAGMIAC